MDNEEAPGDGAGRRTALGLTDHLEDFAARRSAQTWEEFSREDPFNWRSYFLELADDPGTTILFNLHNVNAWLGVARAAAPGHSPTDWELFQIHEHGAWWPRIEWWDEDARTSNPFD